MGLSKMNLLGIPLHSWATLYTCTGINNICNLFLKLTIKEYENRFMHLIVLTLEWIHTWIFKPGKHLEISLVGEVRMHVNVCLLLRLLITSGVLWCDNKYYSFYGSCSQCFSSCDLSLACYRNQPNRSNLALYNRINSCFNTIVTGWNTSDIKVGIVCVAYQGNKKKSWLDLQINKWLWIIKPF